MMSEDNLNPGQLIFGERNYEVASALVVARTQRELKIFDPDLSRGGYQSLNMYRLLQDFLASDRLNRLHIMVHDSQYLTSKCPRLVELLKRYGHAMTIYLTDERAQVAQDAFVLADDSHYLHRFHIDHARFKYVLGDAIAAQPLHERFEQLLETTHSTLSVTTMGL